MLIGLTGRIYAGKGTVIKYFLKKNFKNYTISDFVKEEVLRRGLEVNRKTLQDIGDLVKREKGPEIWTRRIIEQSQEENYLIDGIRHPSEIEEIRKVENSWIIALDAPVKSRYQEMLRINRGIDSPKYEEFLASDERDYDDGTELGFRVKDCIPMADVVIINDSTIEEFHRKINDFYKKIKC